jgi:hypothetical protein
MEAGQQDGADGCAAARGDDHERLRGRLRLGHLRRREPVLLVRAAPYYLGMQPEVAAGETTTFPSTTSALTDDAPHMQGDSSVLAPLACADLNASTATAAAIIRQTLTRGRRPQNLTTRGCQAASPSTMGRVAHLRARRVLSSMKQGELALPRKALRDRTRTRHGPPHLYARFTRAPGNRRLRASISGYL